jgi:NAD(P)-dependent dehydrogenase (short-subunit alcohol dehydrogenase family)
VEILLAEGARVVGVDLRAEGLAWMDGVGGAVGLAADVTDPAANEAMVDLALSRFGALHAVALNAGIVVHRMIDGGSLEDFDRVMDVNVRAVVLGIRAALGPLEAAGDGVIVVTGSLSGLFGDSGLWPPTHPRLRWSTSCAPRRSTSHTGGCGSTPSAPGRPAAP